MSKPVGPVDRSGNSVEVLPKFSKNTRLQVVTLIVSGLLISAGILLCIYTKPPFSIVGAASFSMSIPILLSSVIPFIYRRCITGESEEPKPTLQKKMASLVVKLKDLPEIEFKKSAREFQSTDFQEHKAVRGKDENENEFLAVLIEGKTWVFTFPRGSKDVFCYQNGEDAPELLNSENIQKINNIYIQSR